MLLSVVLFALLGFLMWKNYFAPQQEAATKPAAFDQQFTDFTARQFNKNGELAWNVHGSELNHLTEDKGYRFKQVACLLESKDKNAPPWRLSAPSGSADERLTTVELTGGVKGHRAPTVNQGALIMSTQSMTIKPQKQTVSSRDPTALSEINHKEQPRWTSDSDGFKLDYSTQVFQQLKVRDHYNRPHNLPENMPASAQDKSNTHQGAHP